MIVEKHLKRLLGLKEIHIFLFCTVGFENFGVFDLV